jgi:hypothetical protein
MNAATTEFVGDIGRDGPAAYAAAAMFREFVVQTEHLIVGHAVSLGHSAQDANVVRVARLGATTVHAYLTVGIPMDENLVRRWRRADRFDRRLGQRLNEHVEQVSPAIVLAVFRQSVASVVVDMDDVMDEV